jgi:hypothetical protein
MGLLVSSDPNILCRHTKFSGPRGYRATEVQPSAEKIEELE